MDKKYATNWREAAPYPRTLYGKARSILRNLLLGVVTSKKNVENQNFLRAIYCHYVFDDQKEEFESILLKLKTIGSFVDTATCLQILNSADRIDGRYFHLSFDDGFRNNFTNAVPILRKHKIPALFFVPTALIGAGWEDTQDYCLNKTLYSGVIEMLNWEDLRIMNTLGFEIGSHTKTHARLSEISGNTSALEDEIIGSKREIERMTGKECKYISWPYGKLTDADSGSIKVVTDAGYEACFGAYRGSVIPGKTDIFSIPRHLFEVQWPLSHILYFMSGKMEEKEW